MDSPEPTDWGAASFKAVSGASYSAGKVERTLARAFSRAIKTNTATVPMHLHSCFFGVLSLLRAEPAGLDEGEAPAGTQKPPSTSSAPRRRALTTYYGT